MRRTYGVVLAATLLVIGLVPLIASGSESAPTNPTIPHYTGCLTGSTLVQIAVGDSPSKPCGSNQQAVTFSAGDITDVNAATGLTGGGSNGGVTLAIASGYQLPQGCSAGQLPKSTDGTSWGCGDDNNTQYAAGTGINLNGTTFSLANGFQLPQSCSAGQLAKATSSSSWQCGNDNNTQYSAGSGLHLNSATNTFTSDTSTMQARIDKTCPSGSAISSIGADGSVTCQTTSSAGVTGVHIVQVFRRVDVKSLLQTDAMCPDGEIAIGGGAFLPGGIDTGEIIMSSPIAAEHDTEATGWTATVRQDSDPSQPYLMHVTAICAVQSS